MLFDRIPSGYPGADEVFDNIRMGDNVVWQVTELAEYRLFAQPFADRAIDNNGPLEEALEQIEKELTGL